MASRLVSGWPLVTLTCLISVACGGRTDDVGGGNSPSGSGGNGDTGTGGTATGGTATGGTVSLNDLVLSCERACSVIDRCENADDDCRAGCVGEFLDQPEQCQSAFYDFVRCAADALLATQTCDLEGVLDTRCGAQLAIAEHCQDSFEPDPEPTPVDPPAPGPSTGCSGWGSAGVDYCEQGYACPEGTYSLWCRAMADGTATCSCTGPSSGAASFSLQAGPTMCTEAARLCSFPS